MFTFDTIIWAILMEVKDMWNQLSGHLVNAQMLPVGGRLSMHLKGLSFVFLSKVQLFLCSC